MTCTTKYYAEKLRAGELKLYQIPKELRHDVISLLREMLAIDELRNHGMRIRTSNVKPS